VLSADQRQRLAEKCAERVLTYSGFERTLVVCDDPAVAQWAQLLGIGVLVVASEGLNASLQEALEVLLDESPPSEVVIVHGDLAFPESLVALDQLAPLDFDTSKRIFIIPDRHGQGTNVLGVGSGLLRHWRFAYGEKSFQAHCDQAQLLSAKLDIIHHADLGVDIDTPDDLQDERVRNVVISHLPDWNPHEQ
jgi:2-phospho-L-lactate guanylyltransferase